MVYKQGSIELESGETSYSVTFDSAFEYVPDLIITDVYNAAESETPHWIEAVVTSRTEEGFTVDLVTAPPDDDYVLSWFAGAGDILGSGGGNGVPFENLPLFTPPNLPNSSTFPVVVPGTVTKAFQIRWDKLLSVIGNSHNHYINQILNATAIGRKLMGAASAAAARTAISAAATVHTHEASDLSDSTALGRSILTAGTAADVRTAAGAAATTHTHLSTSISDSTSVGRALLTATNQAAALSAAGAAPSSHTHSASAISDSTSVGRSVLTAADEAAARAGILSLSNQGWEGTVSITGGSTNISDTHISKKIIVGTASITAVFDPANFTTGYGRVAFSIASGLSVNLSGTGGATFATSQGASLSTSSTLTSGFYVLENVANLWTITAYTGAFGKQLAATANAAAAKTLLSLEANDITNAGTVGKAVLTAASEAEALAAIGALGTSVTVVNIGTDSEEEISDATSTTLANKLFVCSREGKQILKIDDVFSTNVGERFFIFVNVNRAYKVFLEFVDPLRVRGFLGLNSNVGDGVMLSGGDLVEVVLFSEGSGYSNFAISKPIPEAVEDTLWVDGDLGDDTTAKLGSEARPYATLAAARATNVPVCIVKPGVYENSTALEMQTIEWYFEDGAIVEHTSDSVPMFSASDSVTSFKVKGKGKFTSLGTAPILSVTGSATKTIEIEAELIAGSPAVTLTGSGNLLDSYIKVNKLNGSISLSNTSSTTNPAHNLHMSVGAWTATTLIVGPSISSYPLYITCDKVVCDTLRSQTGGFRCNIVCSGAFGLSTTTSGTYVGIQTAANDAITITADTLTMRNSTGATVNHGGGKLNIKSTHIKGQIVMAASGLTLTNCTNETSTALAGTGGTQNLRIVGSLTTNLSPATASVDFIGGPVHIDAAIFTS